MENRLLKGSIIGIILIISLILIASGVGAAPSSNNDTSIQTLSKGGLTINYPSDWGYSEAKSNYSIMSISKLDSIDAIRQYHLQVHGIRLLI